MDYKTLRNLPPATYLHPECFWTEMDWAPGAAYAEEQYRKGLEVANSYDTVTIATNSVWGAGREGSSLSSYEGIGYHSCTAPLLRGLISGRAEVVVYREAETGHPRRTVIKPRTEG